MPVQQADSNAFSVPPALDQAMDAHRKGQLAEAERRYRRLLDTPLAGTARDEVLHWLGVLFLQQGRAADARDSLLEAIAGAASRATATRPEHSNPRLPPGASHLNLALALRQLGQTAAARQHLQAVFDAIAPFDATATHLASTQHAAFNALRSATHAALSSLEADTGNHDAALAQIDLAIACVPRDAALHDRRGNLLAACALFADAEAAHRQALTLRAGHAGTHNNLGFAVKAQGRLDDAIWHFRDALRIDPDCVPALINLGQSVALTGDYDQASAPLERAVRLAPQFAPAHHELGNVLSALGEHERAREHFQQAVERDPLAAVSWQNLAASCFETADPEAALAATERAMTLQPALPLARFNAASLQLACGCYQEGWANYEARHQVWPAAREFGVPRLTAANIAALPRAMTVLIHAEQGFGDTLQFVRFVPQFVRQFAAHVDTVVLEVQSSLIGLLTLQAWPANVHLISSGEPLPATLPVIQAHCSLASLPGLLELHSDAAIAAIAGPYLHLPDAPAAAQVPARKRRFTARLAAHFTPRLQRTTARAPLKVGLAWSGKTAGSVGTGPDKRAIPLEDLAPLMALPGIEWHVLQTAISDADRATLQTWQERFALSDHSTRLADFADTARKLGELDHIVTVDTALAHLGGALGCSVSLLLPRAADWRWQASDATGRCLWYPQTERFRQTQRGIWDDVVQRVAEQLTTLAAS